MVTLDEKSDLIRLSFKKKNEFRRMFQKPAHGQIVLKLSAKGFQYNQKTKTGFPHWKNKGVSATPAQQWKRGDKMLCREFSAIFQVVPNQKDNIGYR